MPLIGTYLAALAPGRRSLVPPLAACAALLAVLLYLNALDNPFVYDDYRVILENPSIVDLSNVRAILVRDMMRPVVNISYAIDTAIWGRDAFGYHVTNLLLHAANVVLVFWVAFLACEDRKRQRAQQIGAAVSSNVVAFSTAILFAAHPMLTQAVGYVSGRSEVAYAVFFLMAFLAGRRWMLGGGTRWWLATIGLWGVAVFTKESAAMLPFVLVCYDWFVLDADRAERRRRMVGLYLPVLAITLIAAAGRLVVLTMVEYPDRTTPDWRYALVAVDVFWRFLSMFALPREQAIFHAVPLFDSPLAPRAVAGVVGLLAFLGVSWWFRRVHSLVALGLFWFLLVQIPSSVFFTLGFGEPMAEHRVYVAAIGLFLAWGSAVGIIWARTEGRRTARMVAYAAAGLFVAQLSAQTLVRNVVWDDPVRLAREAARYAPDHWMPRLLLGETYRQSGRCGDAIAEYRAAIALRPQEQFPYTKLAGCLIEGARLDEAERALLQLRAVNPASRDASMGLGVLAAVAGDLDEARSYLLETLQRSPDQAQAKQLLAFVEGTLPEAEHLRLCQEMRVVAQGSFDVDACTQRTSERREPTPAPQ